MEFFLCQILTEAIPGCISKGSFDVLPVILTTLKKAENPSEETKAQWNDDPANWRWGVFYYNPLDKRIFPPKRISGFGWTVNFANP